MKLKYLPCSFFGVFAVAVVLVGTAYCASPSINFVTVESDVRADASIDWLDFSPPAPSQVPIHGLPGYTATITEQHSPGMMAHFFQSPVSPGLGGYIQGAFAPLEHVLSTGFGPNGPMTLTFSSPVAQVGMQIQGGWYGTFVADLSAYDSNNVLLGAFSHSGLSADKADDSAPFIGVVSSQVNISKLIVDVEPYSNFGHYFFISGPTMSLQVPEPSTLLALLVGVSGLAAVRRRPTSLVAAF